MKSDKYIRQFSDCGGECCDDIREEQAKLCPEGYCVHYSSCSSYHDDYGEYNCVIETHFKPVK